MSGLDWIDDAAKAGLELRDATREGHEALRDLKRARRDIDEDRRGMSREIDRLVGDKVDDAVKKGVEAATRRLERGIKDATRQVVRENSASESRLVDEVVDRVLVELRRLGGFLIAEREDQQGGPLLDVLRPRRRS